MFKLYFLSTVSMMAISAVCLLISSAWMRARSGRRIKAVEKRRSKSVSPQERDIACFTKIYKEEITGYLSTFTGDWLIDALYVPNYLSIIERLDSLYRECGENVDLAPLKNIPEMFREIERTVVTADDKLRMQLCLVERGKDILDSIP